MTVLLFFAFLSGIVTILSPCILPVLPVVLTGSVGGKKRPLGVITGFIASFSIFTLALSSLVRAFNIPPDALRVAAVILIIVFGSVMLVPKLQKGFEIIASRLTSRSQNRKSSNGFTGGLLVGLSLGLVWTPCVGPIMASVISLAISQSIDGGTVLIILAYSLGTSIPMLGIMLGGRSLIKRFPLLSKNPGRIQRVFGVLMILVGLSIGFGLDRQFQSVVLNLFPGYGSGLTAFENTESVSKAIRERSKEPPLMMMAGENSVSFDIEPTKGKLGDYGAAPALVTQGEWFNTEVLGKGQGNQVINMEDLRGKVVLLDFWTYSCVNCIRTIPHLRALYDAYGGENFVIIGVHSPEFAFERKPKNVRKAMEELGVTWPVVLDNEFAQWRAYNNRYWPAHYFIDAEGRIRYFHFGEGEYDTAEEVVRALLEEAGNLPSARAEEKQETANRSKTAEIYLGYSRSKGFLSEQNTVKNKMTSYSPERSPKNGEWSLEGDWSISKDFIVTEDTGILELGFNSKNVFLVIEAAEGDGWVEVKLDGKIVENTSDINDGVLSPKESRLYQLVSLPRAGKHILNLEVHGKLRLFAFTFG